MAVILVVEDDELYRTILVAWLERAFPGRGIRTAASLGHAKTLIAEREPEVIVADPGLLDSHGAATILALHKAAPNSLVIGLTGDVGQITAEQAKEAGATLFVEKQSRLPTKVIDTITERLRRRRPNLEAMRKVLNGDGRDSA